MHYLIIPHMFIISPDCVLVGFEKLRLLFKPPQLLVQGWADSRDPENTSRCKFQDHKTGLNPMVSGGALQRDIYQPNIFIKSFCSSFPTMKQCPSRQRVPHHSRHPTRNWTIVRGFMKGIPASGGRPDRTSPPAPLSLKHYGSRMPWICLPFLWHIPFRNSQTDLKKKKFPCLFLFLSNPLNVKFQTTALPCRVVGYQTHECWV